MLTSFMSRFLILSMGTAYPAYRSYKAIKSKNLAEYLNCLRYWIVFACFIVLETVCDTFICWVPLYYEFKILLIVCLLTPPGSRIVYKNIVQPAMVRHEAQIDRFLEQTRAGSYSAILNAGSRLIRYGSDMFINSAFKRSIGNELMFPAFPWNEAQGDDGCAGLARSASTNYVFMDNNWALGGNPNEDAIVSSKQRYQKPGTVNGRYANNLSAQHPRLQQEENDALMTYAQPNSYAVLRTPGPTLRRCERKTNTIRGCVQGASSYGHMMTEAAGAFLSQMGQNYLGMRRNSVARCDRVEDDDYPFVVDCDVNSGAVQKYNDMPPNATYRSLRSSAMRDDGKQTREGDDALVPIRARRLVRRVAACSDNDSDQMSYDCLSPLSTKEGIGSEETMNGQEAISSGAMSNEQVIMASNGAMTRARLRRIRMESARGSFIGNLASRQTEGIGAQSATQVMP